MSLTHRDLAMIQPGYTESDLKKLRLLLFGVWCSITAFVMGLAGIVLVYFAWPSYSIAEVILAGSGCLQGALTLIIVLVWLGSSGDIILVASAAGCFFGPVNAVQLTIVSVRTFIGER